MIYLIESVGRNKNDDKIKSFLKIGYSEDKVFKKRLDTYFLHNPHCDLLYKIPGGTQDQEKLLHYKFKNYLVYRKEWFIDDSGEIIDFFKTHPTVESLEQEFGTANPTYFIRDITGKLTKDFKEIRDGIKSVLCKFYNRQIVPGSLNTKDLLTLYKTTADKYIKEIGKTIFSIEDFKKSFTEGSLDDCLVDIENSTVLSILEEFEDRQNFNDKMKFLCESRVNLSEDEMNVVLDQVPLSYRNYFSSIGPERCRALGYNVTKIRKEFENLFKVSDQSSKVFSEFTVGESYTRKEIKEKLRKIYSDLGIIKVPKATDLEEFFEIKVCKINEGKIRVNGYKIEKKL